MGRACDGVFRDVEEEHGEALGQHRVGDAPAHGPRPHHDHLAAKYSAHRVVVEGAQESDAEQESVGERGKIDARWPQDQCAAKRAVMEGAKVG